MSAGHARDVCDQDLQQLERALIGKRHRAVVNLTDEQMAAAEGWRLAHGIAESSEALGELIRLGLLSEVAKIYRLVADNRPPVAGVSRGVDRKRHEPDKRGD